MSRIEVARDAVLEWSRSVLSHRPPSTESAATSVELPNEVQTVYGDTGLVMTPAQAPAFFARSSSWRCISCGKVHTFEQRVPVALASPCSCTGIEFDPQRELDFSGGPAIGLGQALVLLRTGRERLVYDTGTASARPERT
ncbi:MAG TPA: hypothetical protein VHM00_03760 [Caldimonas sp.]|jgi:hypothetical protein|nr:hypothetical protein [Caldimonas sp.]HEX2540181.1 hypothetical protein [Caldimonas sp.]